MRARLILGLAFVFALAFSASADFTLVRTIPTPAGSNELTGLSDANGNLFAVAKNGPDGSCMYLIDPETGAVLRQACLEGDPPGYPGMPLQFVSCAFNPWGQSEEQILGFDAYWVGDATGVLIRYKWTDTYGPAHAGHCDLEGLGSPVGLVCVDDLVRILDQGTAAIYELKVCFGQPPDPVYLPGAITDPSALCYNGGNWFVSDAAVGKVYELDGLGGLVEVHQLGSFSPRVLSGMTFIGDFLFVASDDDEILVYQFGSPGWEIPEGDSVVVEPIPDELEVGFPAVADSGSLYVHVSEDDPCPAPEGVRFLPDFYEIVVTASFDYVAEVAILTEDPMPEGINPRLVRIFRRPSGDCMPYMDVTVAPFEIVETLRDPRLARLSKRVSEDDEFSVFILGEDMRHPMDVVALKFMYLEEALDAVGGLPVDPMNLMYALLADAGAATGAHMYGRAARLVDQIADVAIATPEIPHTYDPDDPGSNLGGRIVARAHTLSFSLRQLAREERLATQGPMLGMAWAGGSLTLSPNPSSSGFHIGFAAAGTAPVSLRVYSVSGQLVRTLLDNARFGGYRTVNWDSRNDGGVPVGVGTYFAVLSQGERTIVEKLVVRR